MSAPTPTAPPRIRLEPHWKAALAPEFGQPYFRSLTEFVRAEYASAVVYPPAKLIFNAFDLTPFPRVKVVVLGQDPYHGPNQAHGLCFSIPRGLPPPPSLRNIHQELASDVGAVAPAHGNLESWARQGVLLLNAILTVRAGQAGSHAGKGWEQFTTAAIQALNDRRDGLVFLLWGKHAAEKANFINGGRHLVLRAAHPSPFAAHRGFFGCRHFSMTNTHLQSLGLEPINWQLPE